MSGPYEVEPFIINATSQLQQLSFSFESPSVRWTKTKSTLLPPLSNFLFTFSLLTKRMKRTSGQGAAGFFFMQWLKQPFLFEINFFLWIGVRVELLSPRVQASYFVLRLLFSDVPVLSTAFVLSDSPYLERGRFSVNVSHAALKNPLSLRLSNLRSPFGSLVFS